MSRVRQAGRSNNHMKRLRRIIFNGLTVLLLLLFVATVTSWVRSYWVSDVLIWTGKSTWLRGNTAVGRFYFTVMIENNAWVDDPQGSSLVHTQSKEWFDLYREENAIQSHFVDRLVQYGPHAGFEFERWPSALPLDSIGWLAEFQKLVGNFILCIPCWAVLAAFAIVPFIRLFRFLRYRRRLRRG